MHFEDHDIISVADLCLDQAEIDLLKGRGFQEAIACSDGGVFLYHADHWRHCVSSEDMELADWTYYGVTFRALSNEAEKWLGKGETDEDEDR